MNESPAIASANQSRFEAISTRSSLMEQAHHGSDSQMATARGALVLRYRRAIRTYLGALLQNDADADDVTQSVLIKLLEGGFSGAAAERGRFRNYLKVAVRNAALTHLRKRPQAVEHELSDPAIDQDDWDHQWRQAILTSAWRSLREFEQGQPGNLGHTLLQLVTEYPAEDSQQLAARVSSLIGREIRADAVRKQLSRARRKFAQLLLEEVKQTLDDPTPERLEEELAEIGLLKHVRDFLPSESAAGSAIN